MSYIIPHYVFIWSLMLLTIHEARQWFNMFINIDAEEQAKEEEYKRYEAIKHIYN